jgi:hypothetical protein
MIRTSGSSATITFIGNAPGREANSILRHNKLGCRTPPVKSQNES